MGGPSRCRTAIAAVVDDLPGDQLDRPGEAHLLEQHAVVGHEEHGPVEAVDGGLQLLDRRQVEVVGRLVEHEQVGAVRHQQGQRRTGALTRRQRAGRTSDVVGNEPELGEQRPYVGGVPTSHVLEGPQQRRRRDQPIAGLFDLADHHARADAPPAPG